jgi:hypothetical protein
MTRPWVIFEGSWPDELWLLLRSGKRLKGRVLLISFRQPYLSLNELRTTGTHESMVPCFELRKPSRFEKQNHASLGPAFYQTKNLDNRPWLGTVMGFKTQNAHIVLGDRF